MYKQNEKFNKKIATVRKTTKNYNRNLRVENTIIEVKTSIESCNSRLNHAEVKYNLVAL